jgi:hypothetical protein
VLYKQQAFIERELIFYDFMLEMWHNLVSRLGNFIGELESASS